MLTKAVGANLRGIDYFFVSRGDQFESLQLCCLFFKEADLVINT